MVYQTTKHSTDQQYRERGRRTTLLVLLLETKKARKLHATDKCGATEAPNLCDNTVPHQHHHHSPVAPKREKGERGGGVSENEGVRRKR
jgi:hypothetical protein